MKSSLRYLFTALLSVVITTAFAQAPVIKWQKCLGGSLADFGYFIEPASDSGYITVGVTASYDGDITSKHAAADIWVVKLNPSGTKAWQKAYGGSQVDEGFCIRKTNDSGYVIAAASSSNDGDVSSNHGSYDVWIVKLNKTGSIIWQKSFGGSGDDEADYIQQTYDNGYIVAGYSNSTDGDVTGNHGGYDYWIMKLNDTGGTVWRKSLGGSGDDEAFSVVQTNDSNYVVTGFSNSTDGDVSGNHGNYDDWVVKLNDTGGIVWEKSYGGSQYEGSYSIQKTFDGNCVIAGFAQSSDGDLTINKGTEDAWIVKINAANGNLMWQQDYGGSFVDCANFIQQTSDTGYVVAGFSYSGDGDVGINHGLSDVWIMKLKNDGSMQWEQTYGGDSDETSFGIIQTKDPGYVFTGRTKSNDGDVSGNHGAVYGTSDQWVVKLVPDLSVPVVRNNFSSQVKVYPTITHDVVNIILPDGSDSYTITLVNSEGKQMHPHIEQSDKSSIMHVHNLPPGMYILSVSDNRSTASYKIMIE